jgi:hypothetical protein
MKTLAAVLVLVMMSVSLGVGAESDMDGFLKEKKAQTLEFERMKGGREKTTAVDRKSSDVQFVPPAAVPLVNPGLPLVAVPDPVGEYLFSGGPGDTSPLGNTAIVFDALLTEDRHGRPDSAYIFFGRSHRIDIPRILANTFTNGSFTVSFWVKTQDRDGGMKGLVSNERSASPSFWAFNLIDANRMAFRLRNQEGQTVSIAAPIVDDAWHQVTGVRNAQANTISLYVDGQLIETTVGVSGTVDAGGKISVGDHKNLMFVGRIDDIRLWDQALNSAVLAQIHAPEAVEPYEVVDETELPGMPEPVARYLCDGNAEDSSGRGNHGVVNGAELIEDRVGNPERAYLFYKRPHKIKIPRTDATTFASGSFTASFWVRPADEPVGVVELLSNAGGGTPFWAFRYTHEGRVNFYLRNQEGDASSLQAPLSPGVWHHVMGARNAATRTMTLFVDGLPVKTGSAVSGSVDSLGPIYAGDHGNLLFIGRMDEITLWDRAMSDDNMAVFHQESLQLVQTASLSPDEDSRQEPVGVYHFDGDATDSSSEQNHAVVYGAALSQDRFGNDSRAYSFYNRSDRIKIPLTAVNTFSRGSFSVACRVKINEPAQGIRQGLVTNDASANQKWGLFYGNDQVTFFIADKEGQTASLAHPVNVGVWYHIIAVRDAGANTIRLYVNGNRSGSRAGLSGDVDSGGYICVGDGGNLLFRGCMDDVILWRRALTDQDVHDMTTVGPVNPHHVPEGPVMLDGRKTLNKGHLLPKK